MMILSILSATFLSAASAEMGGGSQTCESCGMTVDSVSQAHLKIVDSTGTIHYADCLKCALKLLPKYGSLNITATCDWYGPNAAITIALKDHDDSVVVNPQTALFIDGNCMKNRVLCNQTGVDAIFANNGLSPYLAKLQNVTIASNATVISVVQAARTYAFTESPLPSVTPTPLPSPTPVPTTTLSPTQQPTQTATPKPAVSTPTPAATALPTPTMLVSSKSCDACGMEVTAEDQTKYNVVDGNGQVHYVECAMCALQLVNKYDQLTISTYCDWYGPNYPITVQSRNFGKEVTVTPSTAMFLNGGSCVINRIAYNQTAADQLLTNGYSNYTLSEQQYSLPAKTKVSTVADAVLAIGQSTPNQPSNLPVLLAAAVGVAIIIGSTGAYLKLRVKKVKTGAR